MRDTHRCKGHRLWELNSMNLFLRRNRLPEAILIQPAHIEDIGRISKTFHLFHIDILLIEYLLMTFQLNMSRKNLLRLWYNQINISSQTIESTIRTVLILRISLRSSENMIIHRMKWEKNIEWIPSKRERADDVDHRQSGGVFLAKHWRELERIWNLFLFCRQEEYEAIQYEERRPQLKGRVSVKNGKRVSFRVAKLIHSHSRETGSFHIASLIHHNTKVDIWGNRGLFYPHDIV